LFIAKSQKFVNIFKTNKNEATLDDFSEEIFEEIMHYMYTNKVNVTDKNERKLLETAQNYELKEVINAVNLHRNLRMDPLKRKELETLEQKYNEAKYSYYKTKDRNSIRNPFSQPPNRYY
jgi:hypothetical protein